MASDEIDPFWEALSSSQLQENFSGYVISSSNSDGIEGKMKMKWCVILEDALATFPA